MKDNQKIAEERWRNEKGANAGLRLEDDKRMHVTSNPPTLQFRTGSG